MSKSCCPPIPPSQESSKGSRWRSVLWIALVANAAMFVVEIFAGVSSDSRSLQADALDFFGDAANYAISLGVAGMALAWRARAAMLKAAAMLAFGVWVLAYAAYAMIAGSAPEPQTMGLVGTLALLVNLGVALLLFRYRDGDANMRSVWICTRNDTIGNLAVLAAALGVFGSGQAWPDLMVAGLMAVLAILGSVEIYTQARNELANAQGV